MHRISSRLRVALATLAEDSAASHSEAEVVVADVAAEAASATMCETTTTMDIKEVEAQEVTTMATITVLNCLRRRSRHKTDLQAFHRLHSHHQGCPHSICQSHHPAASGRATLPLLHRKLGLSSRVGIKTDTATIMGMEEDTNRAEGMVRIRGINNRVDMTDDSGIIKVRMGDIRIPGDRDYSNLCWTSDSLNTVHPLVEIRITNPLFYHLPSSTCPTHANLTCLPLLHSEVAML